MAVHSFNYQSKRQETTHVGRVLKVWADDAIQIMSDVWEPGLRAMVWDPEKNEPRSFVVGVYYGNSEDKTFSAEVDATPEVLEQYRNYLVRTVRERRVGEIKSRSREVIEGRRVKVVRGRNSKGTEGLAFKFIFGTYNAGWRSTEEQKVGIATSDEKEMKAGKNGKTYEGYKDVVWVWKRNVEVINPDQYDDFSELDQMVEAEVKRIMESKGGWR